MEARPALHHPHLTLSPISPAVLGPAPREESRHVPYSPRYDDLYHPFAGAWAQAREVFLAGNNLPRRWQGRERFVILETGFGLGNNFLATWAAWLADSQRCTRLTFISIEKHPLRPEDLAKVHRERLLDEDSPVAERLAQRLVDAWPVLTPGWHTLDFDEDDPAPEASSTPGAPPGVSLMLGFGDIAELLPQLLARVDAIYLDGFAPSQNPEMWAPQLLSRLNRLAAPGATAATWSVARPMRNALTQAGFVVERAPGFGGKRDRTHARYEPRHVPAPHPGGLWAHDAPGERHALVIGAGLAGCAAAWALTREGWRVTLLDRHDQAASEASGNAGGLFHSVLHGDDGIHARVLRAASLQTHRLASQWIRHGAMQGQCDGLIRLDDTLTAQQAYALLNRLGMGPDHVQWLNAAQVQEASGLPASCGGWLFHQAGWLAPSEHAALLLNAARQTRLLTWQGDAHVRSLDRQGPMWRALSDGGQVLAQSPTLVLANANGMSELLGTLTGDAAVSPPPLGFSRGQITRVPASTPGGLRSPLLPVAGQGYVLSLANGDVLCGATAQEGDADPQVRTSDDRHNWQIAAELGVVTALDEHAPLPEGTQGRVGWRAVTPDRLPLIGALPLTLEAIARLPKPTRVDQPRLVPRQRTETGGLFVLGGLGSRGITWAALGGRLLAHWVTGSPCPVEVDLRDALDPARFLCRANNRPSALAPPAESHTSDSA